MSTQKEFVKTTAKTLLTLSLIATYATKYGFDVGMDISKTVLKAGENLTDYFFDNKIPKLGIGDDLLEKSTKVVDWGFGMAIQQQQALREKLR